MKSYLPSYIASLLLVLIGERIIGGSSTLHYAFTGLGLVAGLILIIQAKSNSKSSLFFSLLHVLGLFLSILGAETGQELLQISDQNLQMWSVILQSLGAIAILSALLPLFALHYLFSLGQRHSNPQRTKHI